MAKEWAKFESEYKKSSTQYSKITADQGNATSKRLTIACTATTEGENNLRDALVDARKAGVTANTFGEFSKDRGFQEAAKLLSKAANEVEERIKDIHAFGAEASRAAATMAALRNSIEKDLAKRKDSSESKKDIQALLDKVSTDEKNYAKLAKLPDERIKPYYKTYASNLTKTITKLIQEAPEAQAKAKRDMEAPEKLRDRVLNSWFQKCVAAHKQVVTASGDALGKAEKGDKSGVQAALKTAADARKTVKAIADDYADVVKNYKEDVDISKDKAKILAAVAKMAQMDQDAERRVRGVLTTIKKAGG